MELTINPDKAGAATAILCGIHCVLMPVIVVALPQVHIAESWEWLFFTTSFLMGSWSAFSTYRHDREVWPATTMLSGLLILLLPHLLGLPEAIHPVTAVIGASILISIHVRNLRVHAKHHAQPRPVVAQTVDSLTVAS
ncbi:MAG: MerC domain-containing protein [Candidatus Sericytochromatia bacterium]|nr:MerC domain-containing protein [Candidatus Sericytochromatia bacterium]